VLDLVGQTFRDQRNLEAASQAKDEDFLWKFRKVAERSYFESFITVEVLLAVSGDVSVRLEH
jgi:hypothetical protein